MLLTIVDDDVEAAPTSRSNSKAGQPILRPQENHDLHMKQSQQRQQAQLKAVPLIQDHWIEVPKIKGM